MGAAIFSNGTTQVSDEMIERAIKTPNTGSDLESISNHNLTHSEYVRQFVAELSQ